MTDQPIRRESSDTFGRNTKADIELLRRINERNDDHSEELFVLAVVCASALCLCGIIGVIACAIFS